jgi:type I restriction enzyme, S subunit
MSLPSYAEYKNSDVQWLGNIPIHWAVRRLKKLLDAPLMYGANEASDGYSPADPRYVRITDISENGELRDDTFRSLPMEVAQDYLLSDGDILLARSGATVGKSFIYRIEWGVCCFAGYLIRARLNVHAARPAYIYACMQSSFYWQYISSCQIQATIQNVSAEKYGEFVLPLPSILEQDEIVSFLDHETAKIDTLIAEQEKLIALLAEKRQATISHAVTKGLNPEAPMKDSRVEWLGEVPEHWRVVPLMRLTHPLRPIMYGIVLPGVSVESGIPIVKGGDVKPARLKVELLSRTTKEIELPFARARLRPLDIVYSIRGTIGDAEVVPDELLDANITQDVARISPASGVQTSWLIHVMKSKPIFVQLAQRSLGAAVPGINIRELKRAMIPVPPAEEREEIATFLDAEIGRLKALANEAARGITLLKERRSALISAAVTGKIDVRQVVHQEHSSLQEAA